MGYSRGLVLIFGITLISHALTYGEADYHGEISEDASPDTDVKLDRDILVTERENLVGENICGYTLYKTENESLPFKIVLLDEKSGYAKLKLDNGKKLNFREQHTYTFQLAAHDCITGSHAKRETVHVEVLPAAKAASTSDAGAATSKNQQQKTKGDSTWEEESYTLEVEEGKLYDDILQLEIEGLTGDALQRCQFHITTPDVPFTIDNQERMGILRNTEQLNWARQHNYILEVMAYSCGEDEATAKPLVIDIHVKQACVSGWQGVSDVLNYDSQKLIKPIADSAALRVCDDTCDVAKVRVSVTLHSKDAVKGCDRDVASIASQREICGASDEIYDLLPEKNLNKESQNMAGENSEGDVFAFDGKYVAFEVPEEFNHTLQEEFTIMTWMKHEMEEDELTSHKKEHILCNSDGEVKNRHHYSLFIHNCKLVLLMRREYQDGIDMKEFRPAEWRWSVPEVCDGRWHHYAISMDFPSALLYIDGSPFSDLPHHNPDIIDDWALHPVTSVHSTKLVVGACWMGAEERMTQHFKGYLAGTSILNGLTEGDRALKCMTNCAEKLDFHAMSEMKTGMTVSFNSEMSEITIEGTHIDSVQSLFRKVGYENSRINPSQAERSILIRTQVNCTDKRQLMLPDVATAVVVPRAVEDVTIIQITGTTQLSHSARDLVPGVFLFRDVSILAGTKAELAEVITDVKTGSDERVDISVEKLSALNSNYKLDSCIVSVSPHMNFDDYYKEHIKYPENLVDQLMLEVYQKEDGLIISGAERVDNYIDILQQLRYYNSRADDLTTSTFTLTCSELNGEFTSNQFVVKLSVTHEDHLTKDTSDDYPAKLMDTKQKEAAPTKENDSKDKNDVYAPPPMAHAQDASYSHQLKSYPQQNENELKKSFMAHSSHVASGSGLGMVIIVVVCVGFLMLMIVLGVIRIRSTHQRTRDVNDERAEMEWDDSALTITVNPMDQPGAFDEEMAGGHADDTDSDDDDDGMSHCYDDHDDSSEEEPDVRELKSRGLEWDESDMSKFQCKV